MAFDFVEWIKKGGALPLSKGLADALTQTTYTFQNDRLLLEPKDAIKSRLGFSPDEFDSAILTFAEPVSPVARSSGRSRHTFSWEPFGGGAPTTMVDTQGAGGYDPYGGGYG